jgi:transposase
MQDRPNTIVQEDKAPSHASKHQNLVFMDAGVLRLLWPGNSPDLNMIEPCWLWMKRTITRKGAPRNRAAAIKAWTECWTKQLKQERIQHWIERIPRHIQQIIELDGGNEYREGREDGVIRPYDSDDRRTRYLRAKRGFSGSESSEKSISEDVFDVSDDEIDEN